MRTRFISLFILICLSFLPVVGQERLFVPPFDFPLYLSGNFGELRSNHFHGGVDFKTQGVEGKPIRCIADGYISRVSVSPGGYGNAVYITHDNGYTSVHGHLKAFSPEVAAVIKEHQYAHETFAVDTTFEAGRFPLRQGEVFAWAGNSGYSFGPHLHMEIRKTETNEPVDPLVFYKDKIKDTTPPRAREVVLYPQSGSGMVEGESRKRVYTLGKGNRVATPIEAWGRIGVGIAANDYMDGTTNRYGVQTIVLYVDSVEVFRSVVDRFLFTENRTINSWTDYAEYVRRGRWYMKSFSAPGNPLRMLRPADTERGIVTIDEERDYHFLYLLSDLHGNTSSYRFTVRGVRREIPSHYSDAGYRLRWNRFNMVQEQGMELFLPPGVLYDDCDLQVERLRDSSAYSPLFRLGDEPIPLHDYCTLRIAVDSFPVADKGKYYVSATRGKWKGSVGGTFDRGWMETRIRDLGTTYYVAVDTVAPVIEPQGGPVQWNKSGVVSMKVSDNATGIHTYRATLDGQFVLMEYSSKNRRLTCRLADTPVERTGKLRPLVLTVSDPCGNVAVREWMVRH